MKTFRVSHKGKSTATDYENASRYRIDPANNLVLENDNCETVAVFNFEHWEWFLVIETPKNRSKIS